MRNIRFRSFLVFSLSLSLIFVFAISAGAQNKARKYRKSAPVRVRTPQISAYQVKNDLTNRIVRDVPSEEPGDGVANWQFAYNQSKDVEVLRRNVYGNEMTVDASIYARRPNANFDGSFDRLRGVARLYYERGNGVWQLDRIESISLRHSDTGMGGSASYQPSYIAPVQPVTSATTIIPGGITVPVAAGKYQSYSFRVANSAIVTGRFQARGGQQNDIEAYILDSDGYTNWINNHSAPAYYNSGRLTVGNVKTPLGPGAYYLVFNNRFAANEDKVVNVNIQLQADTTAFAGGGYYDPYNGSGAGTINSIRRVYTPTAIPVPQYTPVYTATASNATNTKTYPGNPVQPMNQNQTTIKPRILEVDAYSTERVLPESFDVQNKKYRAFPFTVKPGGEVRGTFSVAGSDDRSIDVFIMTADQYNAWNNYREAVTNYSSGRVTNGRINRTNLRPGSYYLVFSNSYDSRNSKTIEANIQVEYFPEQK
jgi:hypothetical protein